MKSKDLKMFDDVGELIAFLENYNDWRRGADIPMPEPKEIGQALDKAIEILRGLDEKV